MRHLRLMTLVALAALGGSAAAMSVSELERLLRDAPRDSIAFEETRESPWLTMPVQSAGTMHSRPGVLEKRIEAPRPETWRMLPDRLEWTGPDGTATREVLFSQAPGLGVLADALRHVVAGDLESLERTFTMKTGGDRASWTLRLDPRGGDAARYLDYIELKGGESEIRTISVLERNGERTTTRLRPK